MRATGRMGIVNAPNKVPEHQRFYQRQYAQHHRLWKINPRSPYLLIPYNIALYGTFAASMYGMGRKVLGYNSFFGE